MWHYGRQIDRMSDQYKDTIDYMRTTRDAIIKDNVVSLAQAAKALEDNSAVVKTYSESLSRTNEVISANTAVMSRTTEVLRKIEDKLQ